MEQIKPNILNIYLKAAALPHPWKFSLIFQKFKNLPSLNCYKSTRAVIFFCDIFREVSSILSQTIGKMQHGLFWCFLVMALSVGGVKFEKM